MNTRWLRLGAVLLISSVGCVPRPACAEAPPHGAEPKFTFELRGQAPFGRGVGRRGLGDGGGVPGGTIRLPLVAGLGVRGQGSGVGGMGEAWWVVGWM